MNYTNYILLCTLGLTSLCAANGDKPKTPDQKSASQSITFTQNKGQVSDQHFHPRRDILYSGSSNGLVYHLRNNGVSYQLNRVDKWRDKMPDEKFHEKKKMADQTTVYRLDVNWLNCNTDFTVVGDKTLPGSANYYLEVCPNGVFDVKTYSGITYKNIYDHIDLHYYQKEGALKYDYIVAPGADYAQIQLQIEGADQIIQEKNGSILIKTPLGSIREDAPLVYQKGKILKAKWVLNSGKLSFDISGYDARYQMIIDPAVRVWGTYYGGNGQDFSYACAADANSNSYFAGESSTISGTNIATFGSHQFTFGGGSIDAFLVKFNSAGVRQWATYYGGSGEETAYGCSTDSNGDVYIAGTTTSTLSGVISSTLSHQPIFGGGTNDAFLAKFNSSGVRLWATFYGGTAYELGADCATDGSNNVYLCGSSGTSTGTIITTPGSHQSSGGSSFLVKFDALGSRLWGTYYGTNLTSAQGCCTDNSGNVYLTGYSRDNTLISTPGTHQTSYSGPGSGGTTYDGFLVKFDNAGIRQWGTYNGGFNADDFAYACTAGTNGNVYLVGTTTFNASGGSISSGGFQNSYGGGSRDGMVAAFSSTGTRIWGSYLGGSGIENIFDCAADPGGNLLLAGFNQFTGGSLPFIYKIGISGVVQWSMNYGASYSYARAIATDVNSSFYICGETSASNLNSAIASFGAHQTSSGGTHDAFFARFDQCLTDPTVSSPFGVTGPHCLGTTKTLTALGADSYTWVPMGTNGGSVVISPTTTTVYTLQSAVVGCTNSVFYPFTVNIRAAVTPSANSGAVCTGQSFTVYSGGAQTYTVYGGPVYGVSPQVIITPTATSNYSVIATSSDNCVSLVPTVITISVIPNPTITASVSSSVVCSGYSLILTGTGADNYTWSPGGAQSASIIIFPASSTVYSVSGSSFNGCLGVNTATVAVNTLPSPIVTMGGGGICIGKSFTLSPSGGTTYSFSSGTPVVTPNLSTTYTASSTGTNGCIGYASALVSVYPLPVINVNSGSICIGNSFNVIATGAISYTYSGGGSSVLTPTATQTYSVTGTSLAGCVSASPAIGIVNVYSLPTVNVSSSSSVICSGESATLTATGANVMLWNIGLGGSSIVVSPSSTTGFTVTGTDVNGCKNTASLTQTVDECAGLIRFGKEADGVRVYPNPHTGKFVIETAGIRQIKIVDAIGRVLLVQQVLDGLNQIEMANYAHGVYFVIFTKDGFTQNIKIIKE